MQGDDPEWTHNPFPVKVDAESDHMIFEAIGGAAVLTELIVLVVSWYLGSRQRHGVDKNGVKN